MNPTSWNAGTTPSPQYGLAASLLKQPVTPTWSLPNRQNRSGLATEAAGSAYPKKGTFVSSSSRESSSFSHLPLR
jgi:hypothetical protein